MLSYAMLICDDDAGANGHAGAMPCSVDAAAECQ